MDNTGKTTLIQKISEAFGIEVVSSCRSIPLNEQIDWIQQQVERTTPVVYDRFTLFSEQVYGPILRGGSKFDNMDNLTWFEYLAIVLSSMNPIIIYCRPSTATILKSFHERDQMGGTSQNLLELVNRYDMIMLNKLSLLRRCPFQYDWQFDIHAKYIISTICQADSGYNSVFNSLKRLKLKGNRI